MATKKTVAFKGPMKRDNSNKGKTVKVVAKSSGAKPMKQCSCGGHGK